MNERVPWHTRLVLLRPARVAAHLDDLVAAGVIDRAPTLWQVELGVLRMWNRVLLRSDTIGTCAAHPVRPTLRARLLHPRPLRFPFLVWERAIAPLDHSGLSQPAWRMHRHLLAAHHDEDQAMYDLEILSADPDALRAVLADARAVVDGTHPRAAWLRDLCVFEGYHEHLAALVARALDGDLELRPDQRDDPDLSFRAWVRWCLGQPAAPTSAWREIVSALLTGSPGAEPARSGA
ncbi:MAG TPA: hypothetical protein PKA64_01715 [Myxococcota bacterium]|nr:hypothetical protein [Myxococcota bacterium]